MLLHAVKFGLLAGSIKDKKHIHGYIRVYAFHVVAGAGITSS
jgi:hypothetical protein